MPRLLSVNTCEVPLFLRRLPRDGEDPAIERARKHLERERAVAFVLEILETLRADRIEVAA